MPNLPMDKSQGLTRKSLKSLGLYSPYDVSKWCLKHGLSSVYLEHQREQIMEVSWTYFKRPGWVVRDAAQPASDIQCFTLHGDVSIAETRKRAEAWIEATYEVPMKYLRHINASFPAPAVDLILSELDTYYKVWAGDTSSIPSEMLLRFAHEYNIKTPTEILEKELLA